jgi:hypothetical protein
LEKHIVNQDSQVQSTNNQVQTSNDWKEVGHKVEVVGAAFHAVKGLQAVHEGMQEQDGEKVGEGIATVGLAGVATAMTGGAPVVGGIVTSIASAAAGTAVAGALLPVSITVAVGGAVIWGISKLLDR